MTPTKTNTNWFTHTSDKPYDRHHYKLHTKNNKSILFDNYEQLGSVWSQAQLPLRLIGGLILFVVVSTVYSGILGTINKVPLAPGLLELTGVIWLLNYARSNLVRSSDRKRVIDSIGSTWNKFVGR